jgi:hypothetical protein
MEQPVRRNMVVIRRIKEVLIEKPLLEGLTKDGIQ